MLLPHQNYLYYRTQLIKLLESDLKRKYSILEWMKIIYQVLNIGPIVGFHSIVGNKVGPISPLEQTINDSIHRIVIAFWNDMDQVEWGVPGYAIIQDIIKLFYLDLYEIYVNGNKIVRDIPVYSIENLYVFVLFQHRQFPPIRPMLAEIGRAIETHHDSVIYYSYTKYLGDGSCRVIYPNENAPWNRRKIFSAENSP